MCFYHHGIFLLFFLHLLPPPLSPSVRVICPALIHPSLFNTHWQHWKDLFFYVPSISLPPSLSSGYSHSMFSCQLCKKDKFPAETLAWTGTHSWCSPQNPKVFPLFSADTEIITCRSLFIWASGSKFKCFLNVNHEHSLVTVLVSCLNI